MFETAMSPVSGMPCWGDRGDIISVTGNVDFLPAPQNLALQEAMS